MRPFAFLFPLLIAAAAHAQRGLELRAEGEVGTVLVRAYPTDGSLAPVMQATWHAATGTEGDFAFQRLAAPDDGRSLGLDQLLLAGVEQYLDQRVHFEKQGVRTDVPVERLVADIDAMVQAAAREFGATVLATPLSAPTVQQLTRVAHIDWSQARFGVDGGSDQDKYLAIYYYVRTQRQELERQLRVDLSALSAIDVLAPPNAASADPGHTVEVPTVCRHVFDDDNYLCALDLTAGDSGLSTTDTVLTDRLLANIAAQAQAADDKDQPKLRKRDRWLKAELDRINARIDGMDQRKELWALRDRMDAMRADLDRVNAEVEQLRAAPQQGTDNPIAGLSDLTQRNLTIRFEKSSVELGEPYKSLLSEVFEQLARAPGDRLLITGYSDRSGDPATNMTLSEARAKAVRAYLMQRGIAGERLLVNYYGSSRSLGIDPDERRVELEWLR